jgi:hypothetical protein
VWYFRIGHAVWYFRIGHAVWYFLFFILTYIKLIDCNNFFLQIWFSFGTTEFRIEAVRRHIYRQKTMFVFLNYYLCKVIAQMSLSYLD